MSLSSNIKRLRLDKNLTQEQLANKLGISAQAVSKWETSETYPDGSLLLPLAKELNVSLGIGLSVTRNRTSRMHTTAR